MGLETILAVVILTAAYLIKRKFWPVDAPPKVEEKKDLEVDSK